MKTRSDSKLAPHEDFIFQRLVDGNESYQTVADALKKELGIDTSASALSTHFSKHSFRWRAERSAAQATSIEKALKLADFSDAKAKAIAQREFELSVSNLSVKDLVSLRTVDLKAKDLQFQQDKFEMDVAKLALRHVAALKTIAGDRAMNESEKIDKVRERLFGVVAENVNG